MNLPIRRDPFSAPAREAGLNPDMLLVHATDFLAVGWMRRYSAVLRHRLLGARANVLVAWRIEEERADQAGLTCAESPAVSHCYYRPCAEDWPYSLYTMIHGPSKEHCRRTIERIASLARLGDRATLWTTKEYKKQRVALFDRQEEAWERTWR